MVRLAVDVEILPHIGKGSYGNVFKCVDPVTNHPWAVKVMRWGTPRDKERALNEVGIHGMLMRYGCRSVVELHGGGHPMAMVGDDRCCLVQRYHETDLDRIFACTSTSTSDVICERRLACLAYDIVTGIADIHESNVLHRDLKLANILISKSGRVGICDFGLACMAYPSSDQEGDYVVTKRFRPVELLLGAQTHSREVDVWSFGCILLNMLCNGRSPIHGNTEEEILESIVRLFGYYEVASGVLLPGHAFDYKYRLSSEWKSYEGLDLAEQINKARKSPVSPSMVELVRSCLCCDKSQRPSAKEVVGRLEGSYEWLREADRSSELAAWLRADFRLDTGKRDAELKRYILDNMAETSGRQLKLMGSLFKDRYDTRTIVDRIHERMVEVGIPSNVASRPSSPLGLHTPSPRTTLPAPSKRSRMPSSGKEEEASAVATTATVSLASATTVSLAYATTVPSASATTTECRQPVRIFGVGLRQREDCKRIASSYGDKKRVREEEEEENREETVWDLLAGSDDDMIDFD